LKILLTDDLLTKFSLVLNLKFAPENGIMILWNCKSSQAVMWFCVQQTFFCVDWWSRGTP